MKTFFVFEVSYAPCKYKINSYIQVLVKWRPLADSGTPSGCFFFNLTNSSFS